ncbi:MAG: serine hydrolase [Patescibacteria group bacterium]|nr:serine hydrolase [Patescibacteria group bacterium]
MRKFQIIFIILTVVVSLAFFKALGSKKEVSLTAAVLESTQSAQKMAEEFSGVADIAEIMPVKNSSASLNNEEGKIICGSDIFAHVAMAKFINKSDKLFEINNFNHWPIASITKLMTALIASENMDLKKSVILNERMIPENGATEKIKTGESFTGNDLIKIMLTVSSNNAAEALAQSFGREKFLELMNAKAGELNMNETRFYDPSGLSIKNQSVSDDIFYLIKYVYNSRPELLKITRTPRVTALELNSRKKRILTNINQFAGRADFIGGKTGFLEEAQGNLVSVFNIKNNPLVIVVLGSQDRFADTKKLLNCAQ